MEYLIATVTVVQWWFIRIRPGSGFATLVSTTRQHAWCVGRWASMTAEPYVAQHMERSARSIFRWTIHWGVTAEKRMWRSVYGRRGVNRPAMPQLSALVSKIKSMMVIKLIWVKCVCGSICTELCYMYWSNSFSLMIQWKIVAQYKAQQTSKNCKFF